MKKGTGLHYLS